MRYQGRQVDPIALWSDYVDFGNLNLEGDTFLPLVQCPNPDHDTNKRHFQINIEKPLVHCFAGCGISGTYEHAISMIEGVTQREARRRILKHSRVGAPAKKKRKRSSGAATTISPESLRYDTYLAPIAREYLESRGISDSSIARWELGWDADQRRIIIPVKDSRRRPRMLIGRAVREKDHPKYLYPEGIERNRLLFGVCQIDLGLVQSFGVVLVEGSLDAIIMHQHGFTTTLAILGSKLSNSQARQISQLRPAKVYCLFDADGSGIAATNSVIDKLVRHQIRVGRYPKGKTDPAELSRKEAERVIERAISVRRYRSLTASLARSKRQQRQKEAIHFG